MGFCRAAISIALPGEEAVVDPLLLYLKFAEYLSEVNLLTVSRDLKKKNAAPPIKAMASSPKKTKEYYVRMMRDLPNAS